MDDPYVKDVYHKNIIHQYCPPRVRMLYNIFANFLLNYVYQMYQKIYENFISLTPLVKQNIM